MRWRQNSMRQCGGGHVPARIDGHRADRTRAHARGRRGRAGVAGRALSRRSRRFNRRLIQPRLCRCDERPCGGHLCLLRVSPLAIDPRPHRSTRSGMLAFHACSHGACAARRHDRCFRNSPTLTSACRIHPALPARDAFGRFMRCVIIHTTGTTIDKRRSLLILINCSSIIRSPGARECAGNTRFSWPHEADGSCRNTRPGTLTFQPVP